MEEVLLTWGWARRTQSRNDCCREAGGKRLQSWATKEKAWENTASLQNVLCKGKIGENSRCPSRQKLVHKAAPVSARRNVSCGVEGSCYSWRLWQCPYPDFHMWWPVTWKCKPDAFFFSPRLLLAREFYHNDRKETRAGTLIFKHGHKWHTFFTVTENYIQVREESSSSITHVEAKHSVNTAEAFLNCLTSYLS